MYKVALFFALFGYCSGIAPAAIGYSNLAAPAVAYQQPLLGAAPAVAYAQQPLLRAAPAVTYAQQPLLRAAPAVTYAQQPLLRAAPAVAKAVVAAQPEPFDPNPQYNYGYSVSDSLTGDSKTATETRDGGVVQGQYSLVEPDGTIRTVTYTADPVNGFNAVVDRQAPGVVAKAVATPAVAVAQPVLRTAVAAQPILRTAPAVAVPQTVVRAATPVAYPQTVVRAATPVAYPQTVVRAATPVAYPQTVLRAGPAVAAPVVSTTFGSPVVSYSY